MEWTFLNPNLLSCSILTRNTLPLFPSSLPLFIYIPPLLSLPSLSPPLSFLYLSLLLHPLRDLSSLFPLCLFPSLFLPPYLSIFPSLPSLPPPLSPSPPSQWLFITHISTYLTITTTVYCTRRFKRLLFVSCRQHVDVHNPHGGDPPFPRPLAYT